MLMIATYNCTLLFTFMEGMVYLNIAKIYSVSPILCAMLSASFSESDSFGSNYLCLVKSFLFYVILLLKSIQTSPPILNLLAQKNYKSPFEDALLSDTSLANTVISNPWNRHPWK